MKAAVLRMHVRARAVLFIGSAALLATTALLTTASPGRAQTPGVLVGGEWLLEHLGDPDLVLLHVGMRMRGLPEEVIPGSRFLEYHDIAVERNDLSTEIPPVADLEAIFRAVGVSNESRVVVIGDRHFPARVFMTLDYLGHGDRTSVLDGGMAAWKEAGGEVAAELIEATPGDFEANVREDMLVSAEWIQERLDDPSVTLIDARPESEYTGERPGNESLRGGHIPGAYNLYWEDLTEPGESSKLEDMDAVMARFDEAGASKDGIVVNYCLIGMRASYTYMVSRHLGYDTKFYDASWNEWGARDDLPLTVGGHRR